MTHLEQLRSEGLIVPYKGRRIDPKRPVRIYRNLTKRGKWYSIKQGRYVVAHAKAIALTDCRFIVNESGRQRMLRTGRKNVHAYVEGTLPYFAISAVRAPDIYGCESVKYDGTRPYFQALRPPRALTSARWVVANEHGVLAYPGQMELG